MNKYKQELISQRRQFLRQSAATLVGIMSLSTKSWATAMNNLSFRNGERELIAYPQKRKLMRISSRPPNLETPFEVFNEGVLTPNNAFFVRYSLAGIPLSIDPESYRLNILGHIDRPLSLSLGDLKSMGKAEIVAVNQCAGNSRGYASPRVFGAQVGNGSMGNARWVGVPLKSVLEKAGIKSGATLITFNGLDKPVLPETPDFIKALTIEHAMNGEPILAWEMNGEEIPFLNGYPLKLVVPGYFGTYWVKHLGEITVIDKAFEGHDSFFMNKGYRIPDNECLCVPPGTSASKTKEISRLKIRSFITNLKSGQQVKFDQLVKIKGIAFDGGSGIKQVDLSQDGGLTWNATSLAKDLGRFSFREWHLDFIPKRKGGITLVVRATSNSGEVQPMTATWNPAGYQRNVIEFMELLVV